MEDTGMEAGEHSIGSQSLNSEEGIHAVRGNSGFLIK